MKAVEEQPTAFDVEKVVEQLESLKEKGACYDVQCEHCNYSRRCWDGEYADSLALDKAIDIVKRGGKMKNKEKFAKEIVEIVFDGSDIAVDKATGKPVHCENIGCPDCMFNEKICSTALKEWAESEYIEKLVISKKDRAFLEHFYPYIHYIARDMDGKIYVYIDKPHKLIDCWESTCEIDKSFNVDLPMVKWSDSEPWLIEDLKKLEVVEDYE